jgi:hypothetical protein
MLVTLNPVPACLSTTGRPAAGRRKRGSFRVSRIDAITPALYRREFRVTILSILYQIMILLSFLRMFFLS